MENIKNSKSDKEILKDYSEYYTKEFQRKVDLIYEANIYNPEALELWKQVRGETWIKPEIREKWEKALREKGIEIN